jgi:UDP-2,3-diacylglucosamine hydrolase
MAFSARWAILPGNMNAGNQPSSRRGLVLSDLHLFTRRSQGQARFDALRARLAEVEVLVLNGDVFDFRWSTFRNHAATRSAARQWLEGVVHNFPWCEVHFLMGNHDCLAAFQADLNSLAGSQPRFQWHEYGMRLGSALFLHGDCAHGRMDASGLRRYRSSWQHGRQRGAWQMAIYRCADRAGFTLWLHHRHFPPQPTVGKVASYLDSACPDWRAVTRDCYFGHTHLPLTRFLHAGIHFHNTGSGIIGMEFNPIFFAVDAGEAAAVNWA